ncbi:MAG TPA: hypothetical protein VM123_14070 [archaeon]|nr:hypothetical protein [archaeon]
MKSEFLKYLLSIGIKDPLIERINSIFEFYKKVCSEEIEKIFISEYIQKDGMRVYENLWFFSKSYIMEAKDFINTDDFDLVYIKNRMLGWTLQKKEYDFENSNEKSRFALTIKFIGDVWAKLKASKENCNSLRDILFRYFLPNFVE